MENSSRHFVEQCLYLPALHLCNSVGQVPQHETILCLAYLPSWLQNRSNWQLQNSLQNTVTHCVISGFHRRVNEKFALLGLYTAETDNYLDFRDNLSVASTRVDLTLKLTLENGIRWVVRNVDNYQSTLCNVPEEQRSQPYTIHR